MIASQEGQGRLAGAFDGNAAHDVALLYQDLFGRAGEAAGLAFWTDAMAHGATLAQVAQGFATSAEFEQHKVGVAQWDFFV
jgi:large repetitive protein